MLLLLGQNLTAQLLDGTTLLLLLRLERRRHLRTYCLYRLSVGRLRPLRLGAQHALALLQHRALRLLPLDAPVHERRRQPRLAQPPRRRRQHPLLPLPTLVQVEPRLPAARQVGLHHPPTRTLLQVRDPRLLLLLQLLRQRLRVLLLLGQNLTAQSLSHRFELSSVLRP